ncbi:hypothetical protein [Roseinatronobacter sp. S2]|nr:hypothetical protein [Roseinatronobacter sp. S2]WFE76488.1 hypothetical protein P8S53_18365 [Roseinatronobacter sp. S2]
MAMLSGAFNTAAIMGDLVAVTDAAPVAAQDGAPKVLPLRLK